MPSNFRAAWPKQLYGDCRKTQVLFASEKYQLLSPFPVTTGISADRKHGDREDGVIVLID